MNSNLSSALCCYINRTSKIQVARITNIRNWYFERVVFPGQKLMFEANPEANLEIHSGMMASAILSDTIPCRQIMLEADATSPSLTPQETQSVELRNEGLPIDQVDSELRGQGQGPAPDLASLSQP